MLRVAEQNVEANFATTISFCSAATCVALTVLAGYLGRSTASRHFLYAAVAGLAASLYCLTDAVLAGKASVALTVWAGRVSMLASSVHGAGWIAFLAAWGGRSLSRFERVLVVASVISGLVALVPGVAIVDAMTERSVPWMDAVYRDPGYGPLATPVLALAYAEQVWAAVVALRMSRHKPTAAAVGGALGLFCLVLLVDWLSTIHVVALPDFVGPALALGLVSIGSVVVADAAASAANSQALERASVAFAERENLAAIGQLAAVVAHEVRNPVAIIFSALATLRHTERTAEDAVLLDIVGEEAERLKQLVSRLLDAVRPFELQYSRTAVGPLLRAAIAQVTTSASVDPGQVELVGEPAGDVECDEILLGQAISNLVQNALLADGRRQPVRVMVSVEASTLCIEVTDDGAGVSPDAQGRLFTPFFTTRASGTGLGLTLVKRIAEAHRGSVSYVSPAGGGASFVLRVPLREPIQGSDTLPLA